MSTRVFYSAWQMQCCGRKFRLNEQVEWTAVKAAPDRIAFLQPFEADGVEWFEEHHGVGGDPVEPLHGTVRAIRAIWQEYVHETAGEPRFVPVPGTVVGDDLGSADGWESENPKTSPYPELRLLGYVVTLDQGRAKALS